MAQANSTLHRKARAFLIRLHPHLLFHWCKLMRNHPLHTQELILQDLSTPEKHWQPPPERCGSACTLAVWLGQSILNSSLKWRPQHFWEVSNGSQQGEMLSDNGKTFKTADKWIATVMKHPSVCSYWIENRISWRFKVLSAEFYFHKPITVHLELYLFYCFIHFLLYIGQYWLRETW